MPVLLSCWSQKFWRCQSFHDEKQLNFCIELQNEHIRRREELFMCAITIDIV